MVGLQTIRPCAAGGWMEIVIVLGAVLLSPAQAAADDLIPSVQASTPQIAALSAVYAFGTKMGTDFRWFVDVSPGITGAKAGVGYGFVERHPNDSAQHTVIGATVVGLYMWLNGPLAKAKAAYVGPELTLMVGWRIQLAVMKRVDAGGWTLSAGIGHAF